ncbi:MAG: MBL fold metallo-hydrolase [Rhodospirillales bacterium]
MLFQNHASLLLEHKGRYLLTDPWFDAPAFGSWMPAFQPYIHPAYMASLGDKLTVLVSHGHNDHLDDKFLSILPKDTPVVTADFGNDSITGRLENIGLRNITIVGEEGAPVAGLWNIRSFIVEEHSHVDAAYLITSDDGAVYHGNDNWRETRDDHTEIIRRAICGYDPKSVLFFAQMNSGSGHPLTYRLLSKEEQDATLRKKLAVMVQGPLKSAEKLGLPRVFSYAGHVAPYVRGKNYHERALPSSASFLRGVMAEYKVESPVAVEEFYPGDWITLPGGEVHKAFLSGYSDEAMDKAVDRYYRVYGQLENCASYRMHNSGGGAEEVNEPLLEKFLTEFDRYVCREVAGPERHYNTILGKSMTVHAVRDSETVLTKSLVFGEGLVAPKEEPANKICYVDTAVLNEMLNGGILFEDLYTGYMAEWSRHPKEEYNLDILMMVEWFGYDYAHNVLPGIRQEFNIPE